METLVIEVLRTPEIQRLRRVRQLGLVHLVFPGAEHSRLVHSLGVSYLAILFGRQLREVGRDFLSRFLVVDEVAVRDFALAALFHDLGHGPLSHAWEREIIGDDYDEVRWRAAMSLGPETTLPQKPKWHVLVGQALLAWPRGDLHKLLEMHERGSSDRLRAFLRGQYHIPYLPRLLDSDIDVDRADFIRRDGMQCGVAYGGYDLNRLISTCTVGKTAENELVVGFDQGKAVRVVEQFLIARRALYETVYYHRTVRAAEGMVALLLRRLKQATATEGPPALKDRIVQPLLKMVSGEAVGPEEFLSVDDFALQVLIDYLAHADGIDVTVQDLARRIISRDLFKLVPCPSSRISDFLRKDGGNERIYDVIGQHFPEPRYYLIKDVLKFRMLSERKEEWGYFVHDQHVATPMREHEVIRPLWRETEDFVRLFAPREVIDKLATLIG
jgi:HD superfamily phosphohydrolase